MATQFKKTGIEGELDVFVDGVRVGRVRKAKEFRAKMGAGGKVGRTEKTVWKSVRPDFSIMLGSSTTRDDAVKKLTRS